MRSGESEIAASPEPPLPGTVFHADHAAPSQVTQPTPPAAVRTKMSIVPARRVVTAGARCVSMPPGIWLQPPQPLPPRYVLTHTPSFVPRTTRSTESSRRETTAGAESVVPG